MQLLQRADVDEKCAVITCLSAVCDAAKEEFQPYYDTVWETILPLMQQNQFLLLRGTSPYLEHAHKAHTFLSHFENNLFLLPLPFSVSLFSLSPSLSLPLPPSLTFSLSLSARVMECIGIMSAYIARDIFCQRVEFLVTVALDGLTVVPQILQMPHGMYYPYRERLATRTSKF